MAECKKCKFYRDLSPTCGPHYLPAVNPYTGRMPNVPPDAFKDMDFMNGLGQCGLYRYAPWWWLRNALGIDG